MATKPQQQQDRTFMWDIKHQIGYVASQTVPIPKPRVVSGTGAVSQMGNIVLELKAKKPLIVTDKILMSLGVVQPCIDSLRSAGFEPEIFDAVEPNPSTHMCEAAYKQYLQSNCDSIIAFGGGSPMDTAKVVGALCCNQKPIREYQGFLNVTMFGLSGSLPPFIAVPTTAGTGSETTIAAIITVPEERLKIAIADPGLVPLVAVLDPLVLQKLPPFITAATGMDALTHAIESYVGRWAYDFTERNSLMAVEKIFKYLVRSYHDGSDLEAREAMLLASYEGGLAFTRASVGYVHAIAHQFGGMYHTPHGAANAMVLPFVLEFYISDEQTGETRVCTDRLFHIAQAAGVASHYKKYKLEERRLVVRRLIDRIKEMNAEMKMPTVVPQMKASEVKEVAIRALKEAHGEIHGSVFNAPYQHMMDLGYPVPKHLTQKGCEEIVSLFLTGEEKEVWLSGTEREKQPAKL